jgi:hypothetical protein
LLQHREQVGGGEMLGGKNTVDGFERKLAAIMQKIR